VRREEEQEKEGGQGKHELAWRRGKAFKLKVGRWQRWQGRQRKATRLCKEGRRGKQGDEVNVSRHGGTVKRSKSKVGRQERWRGGKTGRQDHTKRREEKGKKWIIAY
jgi:hypothetical protein